MTEVHADPRPRGGATAHRVDEHVVLGEVNRRVRVGGQEPCHPRGLAKRRQLGLLQAAGGYKLPPIDKSESGFGLQEGFERRSAVFSDNAQDASVN